MTRRRLTVERSTTPILSSQTVAATEAAIQQYQDIAARGGWTTVPSNAMLRLGSNSSAVSALRQRLIASGDIGRREPETSPVLDSDVEAAVRRFQARHGINDTGVVNQQTFAALNVPAAMRLRQLETNLVRLRSFSRDLGGRYVTANIPAASVETVENGAVVTHHIAGVGKIDRQSPVMQTKAIQINFNPFWTVPASVIRKDLIPKMQADSNYLRDNHIRVYNKDNQELQPEQINWSSLDALNYRFRQDTGGDFNSLGVVRIDIANSYGVYMHDTPAKGVFGDDFRFVSSGCIRLQNVRDYVAWLLKETPGWDRDHIDEVIRSGERVDVKIVAAGAGLLGLRHRLGRARRRDAVPRRHLSEGRRWRRGGPGGVAGTPRRAKHRWREATAAGRRRSQVIYTPPAGAPAGGAAFERFFLLTPRRILNLINSRAFIYLVGRSDRNRSAAAMPT